MSHLDVPPRSARIIRSMPAQVELAELRRFSVEEYHRLAESGAFGDVAPFELIDGLLVRKEMKSPEHERAVEWLAWYLFRNVDEARYSVHVGGPLTLEASEPEPDLLVVPRDAPRPYHPATAALAIEVSVASLRRDLEVKPILYARALVAEYWVVDVAGGRVVVHRSPRGDAYAQVLEVRTGDRIAAPAGLPELAVGELLAATAR